MAEETPAPQATEVGGVTSFQIEGQQTGTTPPPAPAAERPEGLPEGFNTWEEFGKAQLAKATEGETPKDAPTELTAEQKAQTEEALAGFPEENREKARPFIEEAARTGTLSDESVTAAAKAFGVSEDMVRQYLGNAQSQAQTDVVTPLLEEIGGKEVYDQFSAWASANYTPQQLADFNAGLDTDLSGTVKKAVQAWKEQGLGPAPRDITKGVSTPLPAPAVTPYASQQEMTRDMSNPLYQTDPAFRAKVEARVGASDFGNTRIA